MVYNGYYKVMSNIPKMGQLPTPAIPSSNPSGKPSPYAGRLPAIQFWDPKHQLWPGMTWLRWGSADVFFRRKKVSSFLYFDQSPFFSPIGCSMTAVKSAWIWPCAVSISRYFNCSYGKNGSEWLENQLLTDLGQGLMVSSSLIHFNLNSAGCQNQKKLPSAIGHQHAAVTSTRWHHQRLDKYHLDMSM